MVANKTAEADMVPVTAPATRVFDPRMVLVMDQAQNPVIVMEPVLKEIEEVNQVNNGMKRMAFPRDMGKCRFMAGE